MTSTRTHSTHEIGFVAAASRYVLTIDGLPSARVNDVIHDEAGNRAIVSAIYPDNIEALLLDNVSVHPGVQFRIADTVNSVEMGEHLLGSVVDALGNVVRRLDDERAAADSESRELVFDVQAAGVSSRDFIEDQFVTGFSAIDLLVPIGKGQRELIFGPVDSGKTEFLERLLVNQAKQGTICIYALIGKPAPFLDRLIRACASHGVLDKTIILSALSTQQTPSISVAPATAFLIAEYFRDQGRDVMLVLDDLGVHAQYLREIALLSGRVPGRESYPGDIFYRHAHLMERAGHFNEKHGSGTITLFPVMETGRDGYNKLIPTNLMASTDGHLLFSSDIRAEGRLPAVTILESVTRVGHHTQHELQRSIATAISNIVAEYPRQQEFSRFGTQMSQHTREVLRRGGLVHFFLNQRDGPVLTPSDQILMLGLALTSLGIEEDTEEKMREHRAAVLKCVREHEVFAPARKLAESGEGDRDQFVEALEEGKETITQVWQTSKN